MDRIVLKDLSLTCQIGFHAHENIPQKIALDIEAWVVPMQEDVFDNPEAICFNYFTAYQFLKEELPKKPFKLVEALGEWVALSLLEKFQIPKIQVTVHKFPEDLPDLEKISYICERERS